MRVHFIAIGGAAMHNLAIALHHKGFTVTGSDDEIFEPSLSRLKNLGLAPGSFGWFPEKITHDIEGVILGMHARKDNPELLKAQQLGLKIYSYPEYIFEQSKNKTRVVIGGSHGKTSITAMILHVLNFCGKNFDYMVGAQLEGFDTMVRLTNDAPYIILEGDEYLTSPTDLRPKFHLYHPHIALISGIAWDHINVFPTFENYVEQFRIFIDLIEKDGTLIWYSGDGNLRKLVNETKNQIKKIEYSIPVHKIENGISTLLPSNTKLKIFGDHNLSNAEGARLVCNQLGISDADFYLAVSSFKGAAKRLELVAMNEHSACYKDFAHSPSKLKATTHALRKQYPDRKLIAFMELHTFSSLSEKFLEEYKGAMADADVAVVYFNPHTLEHKKLDPISEQQVQKAFGGKNVNVITDSSLILEQIKNTNWNNSNLLMMSSGNFDGINFEQVGKLVVNS